MYFYHAVSHRFDTCDQAIGLHRDGFAHVWLAIVNEGLGLALAPDVAGMLQVLIQSNLTKNLCNALSWNVLCEREDRAGHCGLK